jgi:hypothetical protein
LPKQILLLRHFCTSIPKTNIGEKIAPNMLTAPKNALRRLILEIKIEAINSIPSESILPKYLPHKE